MSDELLKKYAAIVENSDFFKNPNLSNDEQLPSPPEEINVPIKEEEEEFDSYEAFSKFLDANRLYHFENNTRNLEKVIQGVCGYRDLDEFFGDNPGAQEAIVNWIQETVSRVPEWQENLKAQTHEDYLDDFNNPASRHHY